MYLTHRADTRRPGKDDRPQGRGGGILARRSQRTREVDDATCRISAVCARQVPSDCNVCDQYSGKAFRSRIIFLQSPRKSTADGLLYPGGTTCAARRFSFVPFCRRGDPLAVSAAKLEANRRNAQKSTGPRTEKGKKNSKPERRHARLSGRDADFTRRRSRGARGATGRLDGQPGPESEAEIRAVEDAVIYSWRQDRARRAEAALANARLADHDAGSDTTAVVRCRLQSRVDSGRDCANDTSTWQPGTGQSHELEMSELERFLKTAFLG